MDENIELIQFAINEIEKRIGHLKCPLCGNTHKEEFFIDERFYHIPFIVKYFPKKATETTQARIKLAITYISL